MSPISGFRIVPLGLPVLRSGAGRLFHDPVYICLPDFSILPLPEQRRYQNGTRSILHLCRRPHGEAAMFCNSAAILSAPHCFSGEEARLGCFLFFRFQDVSYQILCRILSPATFNCCRRNCFLRKAIAFQVILQHLFFLFQVFPDE